MDVRHATAPDQIPGMTTEQLRARFLADGLFRPGEVRLLYSHEDRLVLGGALPAAGPLTLPNPSALGSATFLERRELGVVNVGPPGTVTVDGSVFELGGRDVLYVGRGTRDVTFEGGAFYLVSTTAHTSHPTTLSTDPERLALGGREGANERVVHKHIHEGGIRSCQLVLGVTVLAPGSMWNTMPCHTHHRRTEAYLYFDLGPDDRVIHLMGEPAQTRNLVVADREAVVSPPWSVHCGFGTRGYAFVWAMGGENQDYQDMVPVAIGDLR
ncbi:5-dehydro-4-deoxy-D-glucuronate isomerase [Herbidospora sp. NEAU-GS84]|uniref:4-deoxy-L-threo-5-hexosulose-uronate ketol-isomerase n=1 Tax=Herbidospora solisilvae TaxID=2696284 RepID=A0A7C9NF07_9ACTN|nr:5-dehydro-4-deoxy-D-glucuronate isomerase [Herbidospora solisilvae]NAS23215.1 5-dehydro-4-deoxy-D-glucuronate isomerase [Herbidospora solisilvae]